MGFDLATPTQAQPARQGMDAPVRDLLLAIPFLILCYIQIAHHILWRDELNALAITWASPTIPSLFWHIHHEGHPWLWYGILWVPSRFTQSVLVLKFVQGIISTAIILLVALRSPFRTWEKALILSSYFFLFEYTVLSRMYGVMLLAFVLYMDRRVRRPDSPILCAVWLGLIASTDSIGILLSLALILEYAAAIYISGRWLFSRKTGAVAMSVYAAIAGFAVWSAKPAKDISWRTTGRPFKNAGDMPHLALAFLRETLLPFFPAKSPRSHFFWNPELHASMWWYVLPMIVVLCLLYWSFRRRWNLVLLVGSSIVGGTLLGHLIYLGSERQMGLTFLAFVGASWILRAAEPARLLPWPVYFLLAISAISSVWTVMESWQRPFSYNQAAAAWIVHDHLDQMPLVGESDTSAISVAEVLHRPVYMIECSCVDTYLLFSSRRDNFTDSDAPARILEAEHFYHDQPLLFMRIFPMKPEEKQALEAEGFQVEAVKTFTEAEEYGENFYFFRLTLTHAPRPAATSMPPA
jgi:hypothetical protein